MYETEDSINLVFEYFHEGDLTKLLANGRTLTQKTSFGIMQQLLEGIKYLHSSKIMHRDIKPENIFIKYNNISLISFYNTRALKPRISVKIADFGLAFDISGGVLPDLKCGTPGYMAPEIATGKPYDEKIDIYSCGVVLYQL